MNHRIHQKAIAGINGGIEYPQLRGNVCFYQRTDGVVVETNICGLPKTDSDFFAFHIHEGNNCAGDTFPNTGGHFNPGRAEHPNHAGDLPPLLSSHGKAYMKVLTDRFCLEEVIGRTVIIHDAPDDFRTQPSGNAGRKIACGVIRKV